MIGRVWAISLNTFREAIRQKIFYALVFFMAVLIMTSFFLGQLSLGADTKVIKDMGLASMMVLGAMISIFMGIGLVFKEIERRTIFTILSKPVSRSEFILGKFLGLALTLAFMVAAMSGLLFLLLATYPDPIDFSILKAVLLIYVELCVLVGVALVFSSYSSSFMSSLFCISFLMLGHLTDDFAQLFRSRAEEMSISADIVERVLGLSLYGLMETLSMFNLDHFVINAEVVHGVPISPTWLVHALFYGFAWLVVLLGIAVVLFRKKDFQ